MKIRFSAYFGGLKKVKILQIQGEKVYFIGKLLKNTKIL